MSSGKVTITGSIPGADKVARALLPTSGATTHSAVNRYDQKRIGSSSDRIERHPGGPAPYIRLCRPLGQHRRLAPTRRCDHDAQRGVS